MYYYQTEKPVTGKGLHGLFDTLSGGPTPRIWMDNARGYRYATLAQDKLPWSTTFTKFFRNLGQEVSELMTYNMFAMAIRVTGQPQFVAIHANKEGIGGHAMIVYRVNGNTLHVADPNYPGILDRSIRFGGESFHSYYSGATAASLGKEYPYIRFIAQSAIVDWNTLNDLYQRMLTDGLTIDLPLFTLSGTTNGKRDVGSFKEWEQGDRFKLTSTDTIFFAALGSVGIAQVWNSLQSEMQPTPLGGLWALKLRPGVSRIGFYVVDALDSWAGFVWVTFEVDAPEEKPGCHFTATMNGTALPENTGSHGSISQGRVFASGVWNEDPTNPYNYSNVEIVTKDSVDGKGTYALGSGTSIKRYTYHAPSNSYFRQDFYGFEGSMTIGEWTSGTFAGTFTFTASPTGLAKDSNVVVAGSFKCID